MIFGNFFYADLCRRTCILPEVSYINRFLIGCVKTSPSSKICKAFFKTISLHFAPCSNKIPTQSKLRAAAGHWFLQNKAWSFISVGIYISKFYNYGLWVQIQSLINLLICWYIDKIFFKQITIYLGIIKCIILFCCWSLG